MSAHVDAWIARATPDAPEADFATCVAESQRRVFQIACGVLGDPAEAEGLRDPARFCAWVSRIALRLALNRRRSRRRQRARETAWQADRPVVTDGAGGLLRIPAGTVRSRLHRARKHLLEVMKP
jgi:DNA-directed RNA polymerase specialized sigma24 family protein